MCWNFLDSNALAVSLYPPPCPGHLLSSLGQFIFCRCRKTFGIFVADCRAVRAETLNEIDLHLFTGFTEGKTERRRERGCQCCPRWNVPIIRAKQTQSSQGICLNFPFLLHLFLFLHLRNLQSVQRASCHKHHTPTQSLTHPAPAPLSHAMVMPAKPYAVIPNQKRGSHCKCSARQAT